MEKGTGEKVVIPNEPQVDVAKLEEELMAQGSIIARTLGLLKQSKKVRGDTLREPFTTPPNPNVGRQE